MTAALLFAALMLQANMAPTFSEEPETPAPAPVRAVVAAAQRPPVKVVSTVTVTAAKAADADDPVSCRTVDVTGTRFGDRRCMSRSQWEQQARDAKDLYESWSAGGATVPTK